MTKVSQLPISPKAQAREDEFDGSGLEVFAHCSKAETEDDDFIAITAACNGFLRCSWISWLRNTSYS